MKVKKPIGIAAIVTIIAFPIATYAAEKTIKYTYDALGRLTFVEDSINGNRDYDYDDAGNRTQVLVGVSDDESNDLSDDSSSGSGSDSGSGSTGGSSGESSAECQAQCGGLTGQVYNSCIASVPFCQ